MAVPGHAFPSRVSIRNTGLYLRVQLAVDFGPGLVSSSSSKEAWQDLVLLCFNDTISHKSQLQVIRMLVPGVPG